jgi:CHAT domain-containing protein
MDQTLYDSLTHTAYALYQNLFHPIENFLAGKDIIVIPDEFLYFLPFGSLIKEIPDSGIINFASLEYLVKHYAFGISYSASLWIRYAGLKRGEMEVLAFAPNTERMEDSTVHSNTLPGSKEELKYLEEHLSGLFIKGKEVTKDTFISLVEDKEALLHIAGHANPGNKREGGYILMGEPGSEGENARLYEYEITTLDLKSDLVNLSACNTGTGVMSQGEGIFSIGRSFTQAGSPSVVFTLWDVNDERTHLIMQDFYGKLIKGEKLNHALRYSKLKYLNTSPSYLAHPYYWAGYQLAGNLSPYKSGFNFLSWAIPGVSVLSFFLLGYLILRNSRRRSDASS